MGVLCCRTQREITVEVFCRRTAPSFTVDVLQTQRKAHRRFCVVERNTKFTVYAYVDERNVELGSHLPCRAQCKAHRSCHPVLSSANTHFTRECNAAQTASPLLWAICVAERKRKSPRRGRFLYHRPAMRTSHRGHVPFPVCGGETLSPARRSETRTPSRPRAEGGASGWCSPTPGRRVRRPTDSQTDVPTTEG